ncbi:DUF3152 domain-containing protein [Streptomyces sp. CAU 1734]|uniref:DUF3152 domain-containing protein n=1 Tax=Streptomyces sp. CAU 1734 TaxID=3140360 RepID=UPI0032612893
MPPPYAAGPHAPAPYGTGFHAPASYNTASHNASHNAAYSAAPPQAPAEHTAAAQGVPRTRGGHPEQYEAGGGWGGAPVPAPPRGGPRRRGGPAPAPAGPRIPGQRAETAGGPADPYASVTDWPDDAPAQTPADAPGDGGREDRGPGAEEPGSPAKGGRGGKGRTLTGIAAAAVTTVLAVVVAGQVAEDRRGGTGTTTSDRDRADEEAPASRSDERQPPSPAAAPPEPPIYETLMAARFSIDPKMKGDGKFEAVPGFDQAPGKGRKVRYRVDIEKGLGMDGKLFADAVQRTLNDNRSWAHNGAMTFERISSGEPRFVITLASPMTTHAWCAKSGLDTSVDNVSCDAAFSDRVVLNAYRWARGSDTYGPGAMHAYRQMLINHEVGHRLGHGHVNCATKGALAPVMQQQTKSLKIGGIQCRPNPWPHPGS